MTNEPRGPLGRVEQAQAKRARRQARNRGYRLHRLFWMPERHGSRVYPAGWVAWVILPGCSPWGSSGPTPEDAVRNAIDAREADEVRWQLYRAGRRGEVDE